MHRRVFCSKQADHAAPSNTGSVRWKFGHSLLKCRSRGLIGWQIRPRYIRHRHQAAHAFPSNLYHLDETSVSTR
jgi:hypothetical protein